METDNSGQQTAAAAPFDPSVFSSSVADTADLQILHPTTRERTGWTITFAGPGHPKQVALSDRLTRKFERERKDRAQAQANGKKVKIDIRESEEIRRENIELIVDQIVTWRGASVEFSRDTAIQMLLDPKFFDLVKQINEFLEDEKTFTKASAKD